MNEVRIGDVWQDLDSRYRNAPPDLARRVRVIAVGDEMVKLENEHTHKITYVKRSRMRPSSTGYKLVERAEAPEPVAAQE